MALLISRRRVVCCLVVGGVFACSDDLATNPRVFGLSITDSRLQIEQGDSAEFHAAVSTNGLFPAAPYFQITGLPGGATWRLSDVQSSATGVTTAVTIVVAASVSPAEYSLHVQATGPGGEVFSVPLTLLVLSVGCPDTAAICRQWATSASASSEYTSGAWSAQQATGVPNVIGCDDSGSAWASLDLDQVEWLEVEFHDAVFPDEVRVFENLGVSSITKVEVRDESGAYHTVHEAVPTRRDCPRELVINATAVSSKIKKVRVTIDQRALKEWNEIDAVRLIGRRR